MRHHFVARIAAKLLIPLILLFALYVQFHGDFGPGGGFQAGVILAAGIVLYALVFGLDRAQAVVTPSLLAWAVPLGVLIFAGTGVVSLLLGGKFLEYNVLAHDPVHGQERGIAWIEYGVGITVASVMLSIFYTFASRPRLYDLDHDGLPDSDATPTTDA